MVKRLTALLLCSLFVTGSALIAEDVKENVKSESTSKRKVYNKRRNGNGKYEKKTETVVATEDTYEQARGSRYTGSSCSTGGCKVNGCNKGNCGHRHHSHACRESNCGVCTRKSIPNKPCCEKAVTVRAEPCLHKHVEYSWTCPATYTEAPCNPCD